MLASKIRFSPNEIVPVHGTINEVHAEYLLKRLDGLDKVLLVILSNGGEIEWTLLVLEALQTIPTVHAKISVADSAAGFLAINAQKRWIMPNGRIMLHYPRTRFRGFKTHEKPLPVDFTDHENFVNAMHLRLKRIGCTCPRVHSRLANGEDVEFSPRQCEQHGLAMVYPVWRLTD